MTNQMTVNLCKVIDKLLRRHMKFRDLVSGLFWLALSIFVCAESTQGTIGTVHSPGSGFFPFWLGTILGAVSIVLLLKNILTKKEEGNIADLWRGTNWGRVILVPISLFVYAILLLKLGYLISTFGLMTLLFVIIERKRIWFDMVIALGVVLVSYLIFHVWLNVSLPKGLFYF